MTEIPVLLLAAGSSSRMGKPKQLLPWGSKTLIEHQITTLLKTGCPVNVILGSSSELIIPLIKNYPVNIFINDNWSRGMGSSVSAGMHHIMQKYHDAKGVLICLVDQPLLTQEYFEKMFNKWKADSQQILASYSASGWTGVPVIIDRCYFEELLKLNDDEGAKKVIKQHENKIILINAGESVEDFDTPHSYEELWKKFVNQSRQ